MAKIKITLKDPDIDSRLLDERGPTTEREARAGENIFRDDKGRQHMRDSPINIAMSRKMITPIQYTAASKFYNHWFRAGLIECFGSADLARVFGTGGEMSDEAAVRHAFHRQRYNQAIALLGHLRTWITQQVICEERQFCDIGFDLGHKNRTRASQTVLDQLRKSLDLLAKEWGIIE